MVIKPCFLYHSPRQDGYICLHPDAYGMKVDEECAGVACPIPEKVKR